MLALKAEVREALRAGRPVVALESTIIAHGLPYPENLQVAMKVEAAVWEEGAVPATVAVRGGRVLVGCSQAELEELARPGAADKVSVHDLPVALARGRLGATTVAATAALAEKAGIDVFVTGGIGGVHRGWQAVPDISADLAALGRANIAVVCAGAKSILDIGATLEALETLGVSVVGLRTGDFPGFYSRDTGYPVPARVESAQEAARVIFARRRLRLDGAVLVVTPLPPEAALERAELERLIAAAEEAARRQGVRGKDVTPFLLNELRLATGGRSLEANVALILNNARQGAHIAAALEELKQSAGNF